MARGNSRGTGRSGHWAVGGICACGRLKVGCAIVTGQGGGLGGHGRREAWQRGRTRRRKGCTWTVEGPRRTGKSGSERKGLDRGEEEHGTDGSRHGDEAKTGGGEGGLPAWWVLKCNTWSDHPRQRRQKGPSEIGFAVQSAERSLFSQSTATRTTGCYPG